MARQSWFAKAREIQMYGLGGVTKLCLKEYLSF